VKKLSRNVRAFTAVSFLNDVASEMIVPLVPTFVVETLGANARTLGAIEGAAQSISSLLKLASGWWSDRVVRRKPFVVAGYALAAAARPLTAAASAAGHVFAVRVADRMGKGVREAPRDALFAESVDPSQRGRAFGFQRAGDNAGAAVGPLVAALLMSAAIGLSERSVFWLSAVPGALAVLTLIVFVRETKADSPKKDRPTLAAVGFGGSFWAFLGVLLLFTLGNSTDAFLLLRASKLGVETPMIPLLWAELNAVKALCNVPGGALSDRFGRKPLIVTGWACYAAAYVGFAFASEPWHAWALFGAYGVFFGLTEGTEKALVADLAPGGRRGAAYGWFNLVVGIAALPASFLFGWLWDAWGPQAAFLAGAGLAGVAALGLLALVRTPRAAGSR
jgi:MFS family permease